MSKLLRSFVVLGLAAVVVAFTAPAASAHPSSKQSKPSTTSTTGYDISYPQCSSKLPTGQAFGIVGVNGGKATTANSCLSTQLKWAWKSVGGTTQRKAQTYLNTANPGEVIDQVTTWPTQDGGAPDPYAGGCNGSNSLGCSWVYGWQRAQYSVENIFVPAATQAGVVSTPGAYTWWLDVETTNTWQSATATGQANNRATLEGMTAYLEQKYDAQVGLYSTAYQWGQVAGTVASSSTLYGLDSWLPGATTTAGAQANCASAPLVAGGKVTLAQYVASRLDHDISCG